MSPFQPAIASVDFDNSRHVDFSDFVIFVDSFGSINAAMDLDGDGDVGFFDFWLFAAAFGAPCVVEHTVRFQSSFSAGRL